MLKNVASQSIQLFAFIPSTGLPKTGDAANITAYVSKDHGAVTVLADTTAAEMDATNAKGVYVFTLAQAETNADELAFTAKSATADVSIVPRFVTTFPTTGILAPATAGRTLVVDAAGLADANMVKAGPTGSGTAQTARDLGASVLLSSGTGTGQLSLSSGLVTPTAAAITAIRDKIVERTAIPFTVGTGSTTAAVVVSATTPATTDADQLKGRVIVFNNDTTTAALRGQAAAIVSHTSGATPTLTCATASFTTAPLSGDTGTIV